ncbi:hypothetical protein KI688_005997 [Linnemannia hyalina]|uniref:Ion transport domain-containing protein n=1 Tax=Linnemannia hyalina TaxID=64524 RepID=A0A9P7Y2W2_9FUNG|nr:hypothetical protein KI688_005997 [Linnemannia hyalina]
MVGKTERDAWNKGPVAINVVTNTNTQSIEWQISLGNLPQGPFELVLGISSQDLDLNAVDSITVGYINGPNQALRRPSEIAIESGAKGAISVILTIETWKGVSLNPGAIGLHFLELHQDSLTMYRDDPSYKKHHPFTWCIDVNLTVDNPPNGTAKEIISYHFSGDGAYAALLTFSTTGQHLEVYRIEQDCPSSPLTASWVLSPYSTTVSDISVSWNATQIVALDLTDKNFTAIYVRQNSKHGTRDFATNAPELSEEQYIANELHQDLGRYSGRGMFYVSGSLNKILSDELFVTFDGMTLVKYSICGRWEEATTITIGGPKDSIDFYPYWKEHLRGDYLVLLNTERAYVSIWNLRKECSVTAMDIPTTISDNPYIVACLSECGWLFVMATRRHIDVYLTETWTSLGSWCLPVTEQMDISDVYFTGESDYITADTSNLAPVIHTQGYVVNINTMTTVNKIHCRNLHPHSLFALDSVDRSAPILLYQTQTTLGALPYADRVVRIFSKAATLCTHDCTPPLFSQPTLSPILQAEVVERTIGPWDRLITLRFISITTRMPTDVAVEVMSVPLPKGSELLSLRWTLVDDHYFLVVAMSSLVPVWKIQATLNDEYELLLVKETTTDADWRICQHHQLHRHDRITNIITATNLLDPRIHDLTGFQDGIVQLSRVFKDADDKSKRGIIQHMERHINHGLDSKNNSATVLTRLCSSWSPEYHEHLLAFIHALFGSASFRWIPTTDMNRETNPISILLGHLNASVVVADIVEIMISYCVHQAKADSDLRFLDPVFLSLRAAVKSKYITPGLLSKTMRTFAHFPARDFRFAMDHHAFALRIFKSRERKKMLHERKNPTLYLTSKNVHRTGNERLTPHLYVASFDMLWVIEEIPFPRQRPLAILLRILLFVTLTTRKRYVCHPFSLRDLDNPALAALIRFKWIVFYSYIAWFYSALILSNQLSDKEDDGPMGNIYNANIVEILVAFVPSIALMAIAFSFNLDLYYFVTALSILILLLQLLFEFRVMKTVGSFLSVLWRALESVKILLAVFAYIIVAYGVVFYYLQYLACEDDKYPKLQDNNSAAFCEHYHDGGMYALVDEKIKTGDWIINVIMVTFLFIVTIMLNILFDLRNNGAWFPEKIYYTATPQEVRDYILESQRLAKKAAAAALPLEDDTQDKTPVLNEPAENAVTTEQQVLEKQQPWVDQLRVDMRAEFKEELREQLEAQNEQIA